MRSLNVVFLLVALSTAAYATKGHKGRNNNNGGGYGGSYGGGYGGGMMQHGYRSNPTMQSGYYGHPVQNQQQYGNQMQNQQHYGNQMQNQQQYGNQMQNQYYVSPMQSQSQYYVSPMQDQLFGNQMQGQYYGSQMLGQYYGNPMLQQQNAGLYNGFSMNQGMYGNQQLGLSPAVGGQQWVNSGAQGNLLGQQLAMQSNLVQPMYQNSYLGQGINMAGSGIVPTFTDLGGNSFDQIVYI